MKRKIVNHNNRKVIKIIKKDNSISYTVRGVYLGIDVKTGKKVTTSITAKTLRSLDKKINQAKLNFESNGSTLKENVVITTFEELCEFWFASYVTWVTSQNTINRVRGYLYTYIIPKFGSYKPDQIKSADVQLWVNQLAKLSQESIDLGTLQAQKGSAKDFGAVAHKLEDIFDFGIVNFGLQQNPVTGIKIPPKPKANKNRVMVLHDDDLRKWLNFLDTLQSTRANRRFIVICNTLLASALRINELLALEIDDLIFETNEIKVSKTLMWKPGDKKLGIKGKMICKNTPKTDAGNRKVSVPSDILVELQSFHNEMNQYFDKHGLPHSNLIFPTIYGNYMCDRNERSTLKRRLMSLGLPDYGFHLFRHTHASMMLNAGLNWKELQARMGHKSISTTMDTYAELAPKKKHEAVNIYLDKLNELHKK
ncbi:tyrosine-type recombinase/integrase [Streptococcus panodentis]|uniref:Site-specific integrase n=1 Tax=Streptococcus panodentis TaxID=1581472 RepID=A0ABS5AV07_9STRE|nr:site-specific integrase [Streptococcus panodentis]MBP2620325.1 site-specific integrase [Streptococcus panodentis]